MNSPFMLVLGLALMFFALGHSCLHYFLAQEKSGQSLPVSDAILPWPKQGRVVALMAFGAALAFGVFAVKIGFGKPRPNALLVFLLFASPLLVHIAWLLSCFHRQSGSWLFLAHQPDPRYLGWALAVPAAVSALSLLAKWIW
jgi:hypothetical protein